MSTNSYLSLRNITQYNAVGSTISSGYVSYVSTGGKAAFTSALGGTSTIGMGLSTVQSNSASGGGYSNWVTAYTGLSNVKRVAMSSNGQYILITINNSTVLYLSSNAGATWSSLGSANGLPATATAYTYGAISANGQYMLVCVNAGSIYVSANYGVTFTNASLPSASQYIWLPFESSTADLMGNSTITMTGTSTPQYVPGKVGTNAINLANTLGSSGTNYIRGTWGGSLNFSVTGWFNAQSTNGTNYQNIFYAYSGGIVLYLNPSTQVVFGAASGGASSVPTVASTSFSLNTWYNFAIIFQANGLCSFYMNGTLIGSSMNTGGYGSYALGSGTQYGIGNTDAGGLSNPFNGYIDDVRIYNYAIPVTPIVPQNWTYCALSGTGQYQVALSAGATTAAAGGNIYYSANYGSTWSLVPSSSAATASTWSSLAVSNTGQYMLAGGANITPLYSGISTATTTSTWTINGVTWVCSASAVYNSSTVAAQAFIGSGGYATSWAGASGAYSTSTPYAYTAGTYSTTVLGGVGSKGGDWLQIQSSTPLVMASYSWASSACAQDPRSYYIVGSTDATNWYPLHSASGNTNPLTSNATAATGYLAINVTGTQYIQGQVVGSFDTVSYPYSTTAYTYFRLIVTNVWAGGTGNVNVGQWFINFSGGASYSTNYGSTWTNTSTTSIIPSSPSAISGNGQYSLTAIGTAGQSALVQSNYVASLYAPGNGCVAYYPFNDPSGTTANITEAIGGYYASLQGTGTTFGNAGKVGTSVYFNGSGYLTLPSTAYTTWTTLSAGSIACWINPSAGALTASGIFQKFTSGQNWYSILSLGQFSYGSGYTAATAGKLYFTMSNTQYSAGCSSTTILSANTWYHVVVTFNGTAVQFYINGQLDNTFYCNWTMSGTPTAMQIAASNASIFTGYIDDFSLWNIALPQITITALYSSQTPTLTSINSAITGTALSYTGQYQVLVTGGTTNNVYYSLNYGSTFTGITVGSTALIGCAVSADGQYYTVSNGTTVYTLNNTTAGNSLAIGYGAGSVNQGQNTIAIGSYAGYQNQVSNSIVLNASGSTLNAVQPGLYVAPIQPYSASSMPLSTLSGLGYGADNQVVSVPLPIGVGQTYNNVTSSRAYNTTYINNTGRPIFVIISSVGNNAGNNYIFFLNVYVNGINIGQSAHTGGTANSSLECISFIVPPGSSYSCNATGTTTPSYNISTWYEMY